MTIRPLATEREIVETINGRAAVLGWQGVVDLHECRAPQLDNMDWVRETMLVAARRAHATIVTDRFHRFSPQGISGVVVIAESHLAIHTWPERRFVAVDVFTCNAKLKMRAAVGHLIHAFRPLRQEFAIIERGGPRIAVEHI